MIHYIECLASRTGQAHGVGVEKDNKRVKWENELSFLFSLTIDQDENK